MNTKQIQMLDEIIVHADGNATICGPLSTCVWDYCRGEFPRKMCGSNKFFIVERVNRDNIVRAAQPTREGALKHLRPGTVLVSIER